MRLIDVFLKKFDNIDDTKAVEKIIRRELPPCFIFKGNCKCANRNESNKYRLSLCSYSQMSSCWEQEYLPGLPTAVRNDMLDKFMKLW